MISMSNPKFTSAEEHAGAVEAMLSAIYRSSGHGSESCEMHTPLDALLEKESAAAVEDDHYAAGSFMLGKFLEWVCAGGVDPRKHMQRFYMVVRALKPSLLRNMSGEQVSLIFAQTRAAESARLAMLGGLYKSAGYKHTAFRVQKSETARRRMSVAQLGNKNRKGGKKVGAK